MGGLQLSDFRAMMGKYNYGSVKIQEDANGSLSLDKVNNFAHRTWRNNVTLSPEENQRVRESFYSAIENFLNAKGLGETGRELLGRIKEDLCGTKKEHALSRNDDVARILDMLDLAVDTGDFNPSAQDNVQDNARENAQDNAQDKTLAERFITRYNPDIGKLEQRQNIARDVIKKAADGLADLKGLSAEARLDDKLVGKVAKLVGISKQRAATFLATRTETILNKSIKFVLKTERSIPSEDIKRMGADSYTQLAIADAVKQLHLETQSDMELSKLTGNAKQTATILMGNASIPVAAMKAEFKTLLPQLANLADGATTEQTVTFNGTEVKFKCAEHRTTATIGKLTMNLPGVKELLASVMNAIDCASAENGMPLEDLAALSKNEQFLNANSNENVGNDRKLQVSKWVLTRAAKVSEIELQGLSTAEFQTIANKVLDGAYGKPVNVEEVRKDITEASNRRVYSPAMLAMVQQYGSIENNQVTFGEKFLAARPKCDPVNQLAADLFCNESVWMLDATAQSVPGERIRQTLLQHQDTVLELLKDDSGLNKLALFDGVNLAAPMQLVLMALRMAGVKDAVSLSAFLNDTGNAKLFTGIETELEDLVNKSMTRLQQKFAALVGDGLVKVESGETWTKTLDEIVAAQQNSGDTVEGKFLAKVMKEYLGKASFAEKRMMLASCLRLATTDAKPDVKFGALLKGAGPVFHKFLQGIPEGQIPETLKGVFEDMKSNLSPIPAEVVNAMLRGLIEKSKGAIIKIEVVETLGSASVGQAFLCKVTDLNGSTRECVVKMLKPDVQNRLARELPILRQFAKEVDGGVEGTMFKTLEGRLSTISEELNFKSETEHIKSGAVYANKVTNVTSVNLVEGIVSDMNILVMEKASGSPLDKYLNKELDAKLNAIIAKTTEGKTVSGVLVHQSEKLSEVLARRTELEGVLAKLEKGQQALIAMSKLWFQEAVFGKGFFHGDLHAGNIMIDQNGKVTVIDYGNAMRLGEEDLGATKKMVCAAAAKSPKDFLDNLKLRLSDAGKTVLENNSEAILRELGEFFDKGDLNDTGARLYIALNIIQRHGIELPKAIYNFAQSQSRLQNAVDALGAKINQVKVLYEQQALKPIPTPLDELSSIGRTTVCNVMKFWEVMNTFRREGGGIYLNDAVRYQLQYLKDDKEWNKAIEDFMERGYDDDAVHSQPRYLTMVDEIVIPMLGMIADVKGKDGQELKARLDPLIEGWKNSDKSKDAAKKLLDGTRRLQIEVVEQFQAVKLPGVKRYGDAVQEAMLAQIGDTSTFIGKGKALKFAGSIGMQLANKVRDAWNQQVDRDKNAKTFQSYVGLTMATCTVGDFDLTNVDAKPGILQQNYETGRRIAFSGKTMAFIKTRGWWQDDEKAAQFMKDWAHNLLNIYRNAAKTHKLQRIINREFGVAVMTEDYRKKYIENFSTLKVEHEDGTLDDLLQGCEQQSLDAIGCDVPIKLPLAYFATVIQPGFFEEFSSEDVDDIEEFKDKMKSLGTDVLKQLVLDEQEIKALAREMYASQPPVKNPTDPKFTVEFYEDAIKNDFQAELKKMLDASLDFIGTGVKMTTDAEDIDE